MEKFEGFNKKDLSAEAKAQAEEESSKGQVENIEDKIKDDLGAKTIVEEKDKASNINDIFNEIQKLGEGHPSIFQGKSFRISDDKSGNLLIKGLIDKPSKILRIEDLEKYRGKWDSKESSLQFRIEKHNLASQHLHELRTRYGISVPAFEYKIGIDDSFGKLAIFTIVEKINGETLHSNWNMISSDELENLFINLIKYHEDKFFNDTHFLSDLCNLSNYMYGHTEDDSKNKIYLHDIEPVITNFNEKFVYYGDGRDRMYSHIKELRNGIDEVENKLGIEFNSFASSYKLLISKMENYFRKRGVQTPMWNND